jgi:cation:H+ antiporter
VNSLPEVIESAGLTNVWTYLTLFLAASLLMIWRLEALQKHGLEGTALGTLVMPYCSGLGNLMFVYVAATQGTPASEVLTNCLVNNVTNLTLILGLPAIIWGLNLAGAAKGKKAGKRAAAADTERRLSRLSLVLTLIAVLFFTGVTWALGSDGQLDASDGLVLVGLFLFWQSFQVIDVLKQNVRQKRSFQLLFYFDLALVVAGGYGLYVSIDWLVAWLSAQKSGFISAEHMGWLSGWLMVLPNAMIAFYYAARQRADIVYSSQIGDGHICIPLCIGLSAIAQPLPVSAVFNDGLVILLASAGLHLGCVMFGRLPRWLGWPLVGAYGWFVATGLR